ncbi:MAG TPA: protein kinase [Polyangiaceae bacterium]|nr:protein kinase [Polyangiaceae bacterium]
MMQASAPVEIGQLLAGKYRVDRVLGAGGMGVVVAATHEQLDQRVAIKFLLPEALANAEVVARFSREARAAVKIQSEHVARVIDVGTLESGAPYIVMEYLEGVDLAHRIAADGRLPVEEAARYLLQACEALAEAHAAGIVHRDLKPANLFLARRADKTSMVKVLDFGISKSTVAGTGGITSTQAVMGSPFYMSPEQLMSAKHVDHRSDIWSLGIVLYEALVGTPPYQADTMPEIVARILQAPPPRLHDQRPDAPAGVDAILARCLAKDPNDRFRDVAELARALAPLSPEGPRSMERIARVLGASLAPQAPATGATPSPASVTAVMSSAHTPQPAVRAATTSPEWSQTHTAAGLPKRSGPLLWVVAAVAGLAGVGVIVLVAMRSRADDTVRGPRGIVTQAEATNAAAPDPVPAPSPVASSPETPASAIASATPPRPAASVAHAAIKPSPPRPSASTKATAVATTPPPPPPPTQTSQGSLHMGIK